VRRLRRNRPSTTNAISVAMPRAAPIPALAGVDSPLLEEGVEDGNVDVDGSAGALVEAEAEAEGVAVAVVEDGVLEAGVPAVREAPSNCSYLAPAPPLSFSHNLHSHSNTSHHQSPLPSQTPTAAHSAAPSRSHPSPPPSCS
jgi:hypothetical protein